jgi:hypothetical protein
MAKVIIGTELKLNVNVAEVDGRNMADSGYNFDIKIIGGSGSKKKVITFSKAGNILSPGLEKVDNANYLVAFNTMDLGLGKVICRVEAHITDSSFAFGDNDGLRTEIAEVDTDIEVIKGSI